MADDTNTAEREAFKAAHQHLDLVERPDAWGRPVFRASHVEASWRGWQARASLTASAGSEPVATIKSWTNGSYWRNYKVEWHRNDLPEGAQLYTHPSPPEGMAGWKWVPVEPTDEMKAAAVKYANGTAVYKNVKAEVLRIEEGIYGEVYEAMIAAAPPLPASEAKEL